MNEVTQLVARLVDLTDQRQAITDQITEVEDLLCATMAGLRPRLWRLELPGLPAIRRHGGKERKAWDHDSLHRQMLALGREDRITNPMTGEIETPEEAVARHVRQCAHVDYWRVKDLARRKIQVDEYCTVSWGRQTIEIIR